MITGSVFALNLSGMLNCSLSQHHLGRILIYFKSCSQVREDTGPHLSTLTNLPPPFRFVVLLVNSRNAFMNGCWGTQWVSLTLVPKCWQVCTCNMTMKTVQISMSRNWLEHTCTCSQSYSVYAVTSCKFRCRTIKSIWLPDLASVNCIGHCQNYILYSLARTVRLKFRCWYGSF